MEPREVSAGGIKDANYKDTRAASATASHVMSACCGDGVLCEADIHAC
jgi:hypothetical protein